MWFYMESFRLFSTLLFILTWNIFVESSHPKYVNSIDINNLENRQQYDGENFTKNFLEIILFTNENGKNNFEGLSDLFDQEVSSINVIKGLEIENILRGEHEDACIKVAIRKCYKALLSVRDKICKLTYRCKRDFKDDFKDHSKSACIVEFDYSKYLPKSPNFREAAEFIDVTRRRYIEICIPIMTKQLKLKQEKEKKIYVPHIFRKSDTKTEKECLIISRDKCIFACQVVRRKLCSIHECGKRKRKFFKKTCKEVCKREYRVNIESSESGSDDYIMLK